MGIYFIAAGKSSKNREKSLDKSFRLNELKPFLPQDISQELKKHFTDDDRIYIWGANSGSKKDLNEVQEGEFAVDVKNKRVMNVFEFCFSFETPHQKLQNFIGWDEKKADKRSYPYVYFLKNPKKPSKTAKSYFGKAFNVNDNPNWLIGQRYFDDVEVKKALYRTDSKSVEDLLGIRKSSMHETKKVSSQVSEEETIVQSPQNSKDKKSNQKSFWRAFWEWIKAFPGSRNR